MPRPTPLRPLTAPDVLDGAVAIIKAEPRTVLAIAAVFVVPVQVLVAYLQRDALGGVGFAEITSDPSLAGTASSSDSAATDATLLALVDGSLALNFVAAALGRLVSAWYSGAALPAGQALRQAAPSPAIVVVWIIVHIAELVGAVLFFLPLLAVMTWFVVTAPVLGVEDVGPFAALRRSVRLTSRRFWPVLGTTLLIGLVGWVLSQTLGILPTSPCCSASTRPGSSWRWAAARYRSSPPRSWPPRPCCSTWICDSDRGPRPRAGLVLSVFDVARNATPAGSPSCWLSYPAG